MPEPIIALQRRLTIAGAIRAGGEKPERGVGRKLEAFRLTSPRRDLVEQAASLYGGPVSSWRSPVGEEWQVYTEAEALPVLLMPSYSLRQTYELWEGATKRVRLCDGVEEELSGGPCLCNAEGVDKCDLYSRLVVALPELDSVLGWRLITRGANAAHELPTMTTLAERVGAGATFVPAQLRLDSRRGVKDGQVVRFVVPVLDLGVGYLALTSGEARGNGAPAALLPASGPSRPSGVVPLDRPEPTVTEALATVAGPVTTAGRKVAEFGATSDDFGAAPTPVVPAEGFAATAAGSEGSYIEARQTRAPTDAQVTKLNVLVGTLRGAGKITTDHLYAAVAAMREVDVRALVEEVGGWDGERLHWAPLRDTLLRPEAHQLIDRLDPLAPPPPQRGPGDFPPGF